VAVAPGGGLTVTAPRASVVLRDTATTAGPNLNDQQRVALEHSRVQRERMQRFVRDRVQGLRTLESVRQRQADARQRSAEAVAAQRQRQQSPLTPLEAAAQAAMEFAVAAATGAH
jgi:hypothetical protein